MQVFSEYAQTAATETIRQQADLFNAAAQGVITLVPAANEGDYSDETFWKNISGLVRTRNAYGSGSVTAVDLEQESITKVKVAGGTVPVRFEPQQFTWIQKNPEEAGVVIGEQLGIGMAAKMLNVSLSAGVSAVANNTDMISDQTAGTLARAGLVSGSAKMGDRSGDIVAWVMHSKPMHDLMGENVSNADRLFEIGNVSVMQDGFGRLMFMTDSPSLVNTTPDPDTYNILGLVPGALMVEDNGDLFTNIETSNGEENIQRTMQSEFTYNVGVKGYSWDKTNGGASPAEAALGTGTNWDKVVSDNKDTAGVLITSQ
jgi:hypothetical protein